MSEAEFLIRRLKEEIETVSERLTDEIIARHHSKTSNGPLFVLIGETHNLLPHQLVQILVLNKLNKTGLRVGFGYEAPHNAVVELYSALNQNFLKSHPGQGGAKITLPSFMEDLHHPATRVIFYPLSFNPSARILMNFLLNESIDTLFNDVARKKISIPLFSRIRRLDRFLSIFPYFDLREPATKKAAEDKFGALNSFSLVSTISQGGIEIRNSFMAERAQMHASAMQADIYVQHCGSAHVFGHLDSFPWPKSPYNQSLTAKFEKKSYEVLSMCLGRTDFIIDIPEEAKNSSALTQETYDLSKIGFQDVETGQEIYVLRQLLPLLGLDTRLIEKYDSDRRFWEQTTIDMIRFSNREKDSDFSQTSSFDPIL